MSYMDRYWINAPSTLQTEHRFHGWRVLAPREFTGQASTVYPVGGPITSMVIRNAALSRGWPPTSKIPEGQT